MFAIIDNHDGTFIVSRTCECGTETSAAVTDVELGAYNRGAFVQEAFPSLTADMREAIFMSGLCSACWDTLFDYDEEEDDPYDYIMAEQEAQLGAIEDYLGIEPSGWEDTRFPNEY